jgi:hypothetical protein
MLQQLRFGKLVLTKFDDISSGLIGTKNTVQQVKLKVTYPHL